jgi:protein O-GlcNAc transferase
MNVDQLCRTAQAAFERQDFAQAETSFRRCLDHSPGHPGAAHGLGVMALAVGDLDDAVEWFTQATKGNPRSQHSWWHLAQAHLRKDNLDAAQVAAETLHRLNPAHVGGLLCLGHIAIKRGRPAAGLGWFARAAWLDPRNLEAASHQCQWTWALGRLTETIAAGRGIVREHPHSEHHLAALITILCADPATDEAALHRHATAWGRLVTPAATAPRSAAARRRDRPRLAILSKSFHEHVIGRFLLPLLRAWPRARFESLWLVEDGPVTDETTQAYRALGDMCVSIAGASDAAALDGLRRIDADILIDLNGHFDFARARLLAHRPAPVIVHYLGGACTLGLPGAVQFRIADAIAEPPGESDRWSTEKILRLPHGFHAYAPLRATLPAGPLPCRRTGRVTFGTTAALYKLNPDVLALWARLLDQVPGSRLLLIKEVFRDPETRDDFAARLAAVGIPADRLELRSAPNQAAFLEGSAFADMDIALDPFPYNGVTTTCEALWMGVPVVALRGHRLIARTAASLLSHIGRPEWIADTPQAYVQIAATLASDPAGLATIRAGLRDELQRSPVGRPEMIAADLADALLTAWQQATH